MTTLFEKFAKKLPAYIPINGIVFKTLFKTLCELIEEKYEPKNICKCANPDIKYMTHCVICKGIII